MNPAIKSRLKCTGALCAAALLIGAGIGFVEIQAEKPESGAQSMQVAGLALGGPFTLTDQNGKTVTEKSFPGQYKLLYFGFTSCPEVCPTELAKITKALNALGPAAEKIQPLFITIDPARDTPKIMKNYIAAFHPRLVGLTGTQKQIDAVTREYKIYASKIPGADAGDYMMSHSSFTYLMNPAGNLAAIYRPEDPADFMASDIKKRLN